MKHIKKFQNILMLLVFLALLIPMMSSCAKEKKPRVQRGDAASEDTMTEDGAQKDVVVVPGNPTTSDSSSGKTTSSKSSSKNPANVFYGTWEKEEQGQSFRYEVFGSASKKGDLYVGKITDQRNVVVADYTIYKDNRIEIAYLPAYYGGNTYTYSYEVSNGGNKITLDSNPPIIYTKGKSNTTIQSDAAKLASGGWTEAGKPSNTLSFSGTSQSGAGWTGRYAFSGSSSDTGIFTITKAGEIVLASDTGGRDTFKYVIRNSDKILDLNLPRKGTQTTYSR